MRREPSLTFEGALKILGRHGPGLIGKLDTVLGGVILAARAGAALAAVVGPVLSPLAMFAAVWGSDDAAGSFALAERALSLEPFDARGHRVALSGALRGRRPAQIAAAHRRVCSALRQLGVPPDPPTAILLQQAARWAGPGVSRVATRSQVPQVP